MSLQRLSISTLVREQSPWFKVVADLEIGCAASGGGGRLFVKLDAAGGFIEIQPGEKIPRQILSDLGVKQLVDAGLGGRILEDGIDPDVEVRPPKDAEGRFIPPPITGYKPLTPEQIADINAVKALGATIEAELIRLDRIYGIPGQRDRVLTNAVDNLQQGLMWVTRFIAKPGTFA